MRGTNCGMHAWLTWRIAQEVWKHPRMDADDLRALPASELRARCAALEVDTSTLIEKAELVAALVDAQEAAAAAEEAAEEEALRQAMLMSEESAESLGALPVAELRARCAARGILTVGLSEKADLVGALLGTSMHVEEASVTSTADASTSSPQAPQGVEVLAAFSERFWCQAVSPADDGAALDALGGKVLLPHSCLAAFAAVLGGALPTTLLLRLTYMESSVYVGVADFVADRTACEWLRPREAVPSTGPPTWGPAGALAAVFVPRWVRGSLSCQDGARVQLALVSLPKASALVLQPQTDGFAAALGMLGDPRDVLTPLFNRLPAVQAGDVLPLELLDERHAVEVVAVRGWPHVRCGRPEAALDLGAALASIGAAGRAQQVPAACIVDADVEIDFVQSSEREAETERVRVAALEAQQAHAEQAARAVAEAAARSDPWSAVNAGEGHVLGGAVRVPPSGAGAEEAAEEHQPALSEREKRLAALERRGL